MMSRGKSYPCQRAVRKPAGSMQELSRSELNSLRSYLYKSKLRFPSGEPVVAPWEMSRSYYPWEERAQVVFWCLGECKAECQGFMNKEGLPIKMGGWLKDRDFCFLALMQDAVVWLAEKWAWGGNREEGLSPPQSSASTWSEPVLPSPGSASCLGSLLGNRIGPLGKSCVSLVC